VVDHEAVAVESHVEGGFTAVGRSRVAEPLLVRRTHEERAKHIQDDIRDLRVPYTVAVGES
jgi:hypothetical protein